MSLLLLFNSSESGPTLALTGNAATSAVGSLGLAATIALTGATGVAAAGSVVASGGAGPNVSISGVVATGFAGAVGSLGGDPTGLIISGVERSILRDWEIHAQANGRAVMRFRVHSQDGTYRPTLDEDVVFGEAGVRLFGGVIESISEAGVGSIGGTPIITTVMARDYNTFPTRRFVSVTIPTGTLKAALQVLITYIPGSVTLDDTQVDGPTIPEVTFADLNVDEALNYLATMTGFVWEISAVKRLQMYSPGTHSAPFNITVPNCKAMGDVTVEPTRSEYANRIILRNDTVRSQADDAGEQATKGIWEMLVSAPDETTQDAADDLAAAILARSTPTLKKVRYRTRELGLATGQTQTITLTARNINNTYLITDLVQRALGTESGIVSDVTAIEGLVYQTGWRETYKRWNGSAVPLAGSVFGSTANRRVPYFLGASGLEAVRSAGPTWVPVSGGSTPGTGSVQVQINTIPRGTTAATVVVRLRAYDAGVSVKARLYDVTDSVACPGESALATGTAWQTVTFSTTLTSGSHFYELQVLPGAANADVFAAGGYVE